MEGKQLNLVLLAVGLGAVNLVYLADFFAGIYANVRRRYTLA